MALPASAALWFLPFVAPITLWVAWSDMKWMKIQNIAVAALLSVYLLIGALVLPFASWVWGLLGFVVVLSAGFVLSLAGAIGAGDAKFAAAMAPFVALGDLSLFLLLFAGVMLVSLMAHRAARRTRVIRGLTPDWQSWHRRDFPMGLALGPCLLFYLCLAAISGGESTL